jgi:hypothetical protein
MWTFCFRVLITRSRTTTNNPMNHMTIGARDAVVAHRMTTQAVTMRRAQLVVDS